MFRVLLGLLFISSIGLQAASDDMKTLHDKHKLGYAAMMNGQSKEAIAAMDQLAANAPRDGYLAMPLQARVRFAKWDQVLAAPEFSDKFPAARTLRHAARAIAYSAKGQIEDARAEMKAFDDAREKVSKDATYGPNKMSLILALAKHHMMGEFRIAERKTDAAIAELKAAVRIEDSLNASEPPEWIVPVRQTLGALLLSLNRDDKAAEVYEADLKKVPDNVWALNGLSKAYAKLGDKQKAATFKARFEKVSLAEHR